MRCFVITTKDYIKHVNIICEICFVFTTKSPSDVAHLIRDAFVVCVLDCVTSLVCGYIFTTTMVLTEQLIHDNDGRQTLVFVIFPALLARIGSPLWSLLFFFMILALGLDSQVRYLFTSLSI